MSQEDNKAVFDEQNQQPAKYMDLINKSKDQQDKEQLELWAEESRQAIEGDILSTRKEIAQVKRKLVAEKSAKPLNPRKVIEVSQQLKALNNGLQALEDLKAELF